MIYRINIFLMLIASIPIHSQVENTDISVFLKPTPIINSSHPNIVEKAKALTEHCHTTSEKVKALYEFVRDSHNEMNFDSYKASDVLELGGNSCHRRSNLLAALCRAAGIPSRLHLQLITIKGFKHESGEEEDLVFTHGITGICIDGYWRLYDPVGNTAKWRVWVQDAYDGRDMTIPFRMESDCLFKETEKINMKTLPVYFVDHTEFLLTFRERIRSGEIGVF
jgi:transglutaminase-like putative cysteine protease